MSNLIPTHELIKNIKPLADMLGVDPFTLLFSPNVDGRELLLKALKKDEVKEDKDND